MNFFSKKSIVGSPQLKNEKKQGFLTNKQLFFFKIDSEQIEIWESERKISYKFTTKFSSIDQTLQDIFSEIFEKKMGTTKNYAWNVRHCPCSRIQNLSWFFYRNKFLQTTFFSTVLVKCEVSWNLFSKMKRYNWMFFWKPCFFSFFNCGLPTIDFFEKKFITL